MRDLDKWSSMYGVYPYDPAYTAFNGNLNKASTSGIGFPNKRNRIAAAFFSHSYPSNSGLYQRQLRIPHFQTWER